MAKLLKSLFLVVAVILMGFLALAAPMNSAPVISPVSDLTVEVGTPISQMIYVTDSDSKILLSGSPLPTGASLTESLVKLPLHSFRFSWIPQVAGDYLIKLRAYDGTVSSAVEEFKVIVTAPIPPPVDSDNDGIIDSLDNCPNVANANQLDTDGDNIGDACEAPIIIDTDKDGVADSADNCPNIANANQADADNDRIGDVCDSNTLSPEEQEYNDYENKFNEYEDDYSYNKKRYNNALDDNDNHDITKYGDNLDELYDNLNDLRDDVEDFINDMEDADDNSNNDVINDADDLVDQITSLMERIDSLLHPETVDTTSTTTTTASSTSTSTANQAQEPKPVIETTYFTPSSTSTSAQTIEKVSTRSNFGYELGLIAGIVVILAVIIFLSVVLLRK